MEHREELLEKHRKRYQERKAEQNEYCRAYYWEHKEEIIERKRRQYQEQKAQRQAEQNEQSNVVNFYPGHQWYDENEITIL